MRQLRYLLAFCLVLLTCGLAAGQCSPCTIWPPSATPSLADSGDKSSVELGVKFRADSEGYVTGVRFYKSTGNGGTHIGNLWNSSGTLLASAQFSGETGSGWQQASFSTPVLISANTTYIASYFAPAGHYAYDVGFFHSAGVDNPPLHALQDGVDGPNSVYSVGATSSFPSSSLNQPNYWVDVVFVPYGSTTAPTITSTNPAAASSGFPVTSSLSANFSTVMDPTTITANTFQVVDAGNNAVSGTVAYVAGTNSATFQPSANLAYQTTYTAVVRGTVGDFLGHIMGNDFSWTFTTGAGPSNAVCPCTIWPSSFVPSVPDSADGSSFELGVKFFADVNGFVTGIRFYKAATNIGTHIGNLWTTSGTLLGSVTFTNESASGWQQATFAQPIPVTAGTTYVASYFDPNGHYSWDEYYLTVSTDNSPLHAPSSSSSGGNGVFAPSASSTFPLSTFNASNYGVDVTYLLQNSTTPPVILSTTPGNGTTGAPLGGVISVQFNEPMDPATITSSAFQLVDASNNVIPGTVTYVPATASLAFQPSLSLFAQAVYTATVQSTVHDAFGNALASSYTWSFTTAPPPGDSGPGGPILVISSSVNPFSRYLGEILLNEGLNEFRIKDITTVTSSVLSQYDVVILGDFPLTGGEASMLSNWVSSGGSLIAMHPDPQLAGVLGLTPTGSTLSDEYMLVNTQAAPGIGIYGQTMQFHGPAELFTLNGATAIATLYASQSLSAGSPAVTLANTGVGQAAAFAYDLARSVVYTRQGNPVWAGEQRDPDLDTQLGSDGGTPEIRASDLFYGNASFDPEPDWVNLNTVQVPQADEQQRLFTNLIQLMNAQRKPLPRFWYLPNGYQAAVIMTGDDHGGNGTQPRFDLYVQQSVANCSVADWTCVRATSYVFPANVTFNPPTSYTSYIAQGFEIALHSDNDPTCSTFTPASLDASIVAGEGRMAQYFPLLPASQTNRTHCVLWSDYDSVPGILFKHGVRLDTSYYYWPDAWVQDRPGLFTGSGLPMRYSDRNGNAIDVYQATTQFPDETTWVYPHDIDTVLGNAVGPLGFYAVVTANMHTDRPQEDGSDSIVASAQAHGVPVVASVQMLQWLDGRNNSTFSNMSWAANTLTFTVSAASGAHNLEVMVPAMSATGPLNAVFVNGVVQNYVLQTVKGLQYAAFLTTGGTYQAVYGQSYSVSGTISGAGGNAATVTLSGAGAATTTADASGKYTFSGLANGAYTVTPSNAGYTFTPTSQGVTVNGANITGVNFSSAAVTYSISGTISGAGGNAATVTLSGAATATTTASASGTYTFSGVANGAYTVTPSKAGYVFTPASQAATVSGANVTGVNFSSAVGLMVVNLSSYYNIYGIATAGNAPKGGGLDGTGNSYNSSTLGLTATYHGLNFTLGPANAPDGVSGVTIPVSGSGYSQLYLLGSASYGAHLNQSIVVTYTDGTTSTFTQSISDWWVPQNYPGETIVSTASNIITSSGAVGADPVDLFGYTFSFTAGKTASSVKLPASRNVVFLAMGLGNPLPTAATPTFSPLPGTFSSAVPVTLSDTTPGGVIHYTTNGTTPTANSPVYNAAIPVTTTTTIAALATASGYNNSAVASGTYTIAAYSISGTISGAGGNAATVTLSGAGAATTTASATGTYTFSGLANGAYTVTPSKTGYTFAPASQSATVNGANVTGVNFSSAAATYSISGTISGLGGNGATVMLNGTASATTTASSSGTYSFSGLANGMYSVVPVMTGYTYGPSSQIKTVNGGNVSGVNFSSTVLGTAVNLASYYNVYGIATLGNPPRSGGFDNDSYAFNSSLLGTSLTYQNLVFPLAGANGLDALYAKTVSLPAGQYGKLFLLGGGVNGNQTNQSIVVTYTDGSTSTFTQSFSDWAFPQKYTGETTVAANGSRIGPNGQTATPAVNVYGYTFTLNTGKTVASVKLPNNRNVVFLGIGLGSPTPTPITPYVQVNGGSWQTTTTATVNNGSTVNLGPQPLTSTWSWIGPNGFTSTSREIDTIRLSTGVNVFVATYTNSSGAQTVQPFVITSN